MGENSRGDRGVKPPTIERRKERTEAKKHKNYLTPENQEKLAHYKTIDWAKIRAGLSKNELERLDGFVDSFQWAIDKLINGEIDSAYEDHDSRKSMADEYNGYFFQSYRDLIEGFSGEMNLHNRLVERGRWLDQGKGIQVLECGRISEDGRPTLIITIKPSDKQGYFLVEAEFIEGGDQWSVSQSTKNFFNIHGESRKVNQAIRSAILELPLSSLSHLDGLVSWEKGITINPDIPELLIQEGEIDCEKKLVKKMPVPLPPPVDLPDIKAVKQRIEPSKPTTPPVSAQVPPDSVEELPVDTDHEKVVIEPSPQRQSEQPINRLRELEDELRQKEAALEGTYAGGKVKRFFTGLIGGKDDFIVEMKRDKLKNEINGLKRRIEELKSRNK